MLSSKVTLAPNASIVSVRSLVDVDGITNSISRSYNLAIIANAMPVLPLVASINLEPAFISPLSNAERIIFNAGRSFTLPPGLSPSSFAYIVTFGLGFNFFISTIGVLPTRSIMLAISGFNLFYNFDIGAMIDGRAGGNAFSEPYITANDAIMSNYCFSTKNCCARINDNMILNGWMSFY